MLIVTTHFGLASRTIRTVAACLLVASGGNGGAEDG